MTETAAPGSPLRAFLRLVMIEHSVFALPFAYLAALAAMVWLQPADPVVRWGDLLLVTTAMVGARTFAMAANRIIDRHIDAQNPRTAQRELVTGAVSLRTAYTGAAVAAGVFLVSAALLSPLALLLSPVALALVTVYPYGKRFTWAPHALLGVAQAAGPVGAWVGVTGELGALPLGLAVGLWIGGFDIIYACQDVESDRRTGVQSLPARFGVAASLWVSRATHLLAVLAFVWFGVEYGFGWIYGVGVALVAVALAYEHTLVTPHDLGRVTRAFFTVNGFIAVALFCFGVADLVVLQGLALLP